MTGAGFRKRGQSMTSLRSKRNINSDKQTIKINLKSSAFDNKYLKIKPQNNGDELDIIKAYFSAQVGK